MDDQAVHPLDRLLADVIRDEGGTCEPAAVKTDLAASIDEIHADRVAHGTPAAAPYCYYNILGGVAIFTVVGQGLEMFVVSCPKTAQWELVNRFDRISRDDVDGYRTRLREKYGKEMPDLVIRPDLAVDWLYPDVGGEDEEEAAAPVVAAAATAGPPTAPHATAVVDVGSPAVDAGAEAVDPRLAVLGALAEQESEPAPAPGDAVEAESEPVYEADQYLEQMMDAVRKAGGGKGRRPWRPSDFG